MKTPEKIKKGLECCNRRTSLVYEKCDDCPYHGEEECMRKMELDALAYIRQLEAKVPKWISVKERMPEDEERVLFFAKKPILTIDTTFGWWVKTTKRYKVTHWMPLPEPPGEDS